MGGGGQFYDKAPELLDFEKARINGEKLSHFDEQRLRNHQLRRARRMYLNTLTLSDREPLWKIGHHGVRNYELGLEPGQLGGGARTAQGHYRLIRFVDDFGARFFDKLGENRSVSGLERMYNGPIGWYQNMLSFARRGVKLGVAGGIFVTLGSFVLYACEWQGFVSRYTLDNPCFKQLPPPAYPGDDTITAHMCDLELTRGQHAMKWKNGVEQSYSTDGKGFPAGTKFDWLTGKAVLPQDLPNNAYYNSNSSVPLDVLNRVGHASQ